MDTVTKAIDVLFHLHGTRAPAGVTAIAEALSMPKANVHRLLRSLASRGLVERVERGRYVPGIALVTLGLGALAQDPVVAVARPELESGADRIGETLFLATARARRIVVLDRVEGGGVLRAAPPIGQTIPVHATAMGRLFLAFARDRIALPEPPFETFTDSTRVDLESLETEVERARIQGFSINRSEWIPGLVVAAAPVFVDGVLHATVAAAAPSVRVPEAAEDGLARAVVEVAVAIGVRLEEADMKVWLDGDVMDVEQARIPVTDHGLLYGDGIFEGLRVYAGGVFRLDHHLARLECSAKLLGLTLPGGVAGMRDIVLATAAAFGSRESYVRLIVTRGDGPLGVDPTRCGPPRPICMVSALELYPADTVARGLSLITASLRRPASDVLDPRVKSLNYLNSVLAKLEARRQGADEALILNGAGAIAEASVANLFLVRRGVLMTPPVTDGALEGITRGSVLELARASGMAVEERSLGRADLMAADEVFLTGTGARMVAVRSLDGQDVGRGSGRPVMATLLAAFEDLVRRDGVPVPGLT